MSTKTHNFKLVNADTDSIMVCKEDQSIFTEDEENELLEELNSLYPSTIRWEDDGNYKKVIVFKIKNYVLYDGKKIIFKGSSVKSSSKESALQEFIQKTIQHLIHEPGVSELGEIYKSYVKEILNIQEIKRWASRKTLTDKTFNSTRLNERKIASAVEDSEYAEGDRVWVFFKNDNTLELVENFKGDYNKAALLKKLYMTAKLFETVLPNFKDIYTNYSLVKHQKALGLK